MPFDLPNLVRFAGQVGLAITGAAALWGATFHFMGARSTGDRHHAFFLLERLMTPVLSGGLALFLISWFMGATVFYPMPAFMHEGVRLISETDLIAHGYRVTAGLVALLAAFSVLAGPVMRFSSSAFLHRHRGKAFLVQFLLAAAIMSLSAWSGEWSRTQAYFSLHSLHSVFTIGTVIVVDFLYLATSNHHLVKRTLYRFFPVMSKVILIGLGLDFLSNALVIHDVTLSGAQFMFSQTVTAIIVINGALLSGDINDAMISSLHTKDSPFFSPRFRMAVRVSGAASIVSWTAITFVDFFSLPYTYAQMMLVYVLMVAAAYVGESVSEKTLKDTLGRLIPSRAG